MPSAHRLTVHTDDGAVRGAVTYVKQLSPGVAELHILTSGWLKVGSYPARYSAPKDEVDGTFAVVDYENGIGDSWLFKGVFARAYQGQAEAEMSMWEDSFIRLAMASTAESSAAH